MSKSPGRQMAATTLAEPSPTPRPGYSQMHVSRLLRRALSRLEATEAAA